MSDYAIKRFFSFIRRELTDYEEEVFKFLDEIKILEKQDKEKIDYKKVVFIPFWGALLEGLYKFQVLRDRERLKKLMQKFYSNHIGYVRLGIYSFFKERFEEKVKNWIKFYQPQLVEVRRKEYLNNVNSALAGDVQGFVELYETFYGDIVESIKPLMYQFYIEEFDDIRKALKNDIDVNNPEVSSILKGVSEEISPVFDNVPKVTQQQWEMLIKLPASSWATPMFRDELVFIHEAFTQGYPVKDFVFYYIYFPFLSALKDFKKYLENFSLSKPKKPAKQIKKPLSFRVKEQYRDNVRRLIIALSKELDFVDMLKTDLKYAVEVFLSDDLTKFSEPVYIGCETTQFAYIIDGMDKYFENLTFTAIERSGLFISKQGNTIKRTNLSSAMSKTKDTGVKREELIKELFRRYF